MTKNFDFSELMRMFLEADENEDGVVNYDEHNAYFDAHHPMSSAAGDTERQRKQIFNQVDRNGDSFVTLRGEN